MLNPIPMRLRRYVLMIAQIEAEDVEE